MSVPSVWPVRNERRHAAMAKDMDKINSRLSNIENIVEQLSDKLNDVMAILSPKSHIVHPPPGLQINVDKDHQDYQHRIERLETILVCSPPEPFQPSVSAVLDMLILKSIEEEAETREPDVELTPEKTKPISMRLNFDACEDAQKTMEPSSVEDIFAQCSAIAHKVRDEVQEMVADKKHDQLEQLIVQKFGDILSECPLQPRTSLDRDTIRKTYERHDQHWIWPRICHRYHSGTGDPCAKSDTFLKIMYIIHDVLNPDKPDRYINSGP